MNHVKDITRYNELTGPCLQYHRMKIYFFLPFFGLAYFAANESRKLSA